MRSEKEMMDSIMRFAEEEPAVRAAVLNGSRVNPHAAKDRFQDYDIVFFVNEVRHWVEDRSWIGRFGDILIMQLPDEGTLLADEPRESFAYLMLFADGNRIDLTFSPARELPEWKHDSLTLVLLDKDGLIGQLPPPNLNDYMTEHPSQSHFAECCNEFWWVGTYIAKGLARGELYYAKFHIERPVRDMLIYMLNWYIAAGSNFKANPGKLGKYYEQLLPPDMWSKFKLTFADSDPEKIWKALFMMCDLFREAAEETAERLGYVYNRDEDRRVSAYLKSIYQSMFPGNGVS
ncbi:aminoglycoside 6-adenylyltransferase [Paenibacillus sp. GCM10027627]|uniref:aminoglycoside 6-adenylyltransferase n=1 Tax=unclassified Paenibacillus TaxID=185978 RepID=UPI0036424884